MPEDIKNPNLQLFNHYSEYYEQEEAIAQTYSDAYISATSEETIAEYVRVINEHGSPDVPFTKDEIYHLQSLVVKLRALNRRSNLRTKMSTDRVEGKKKEVEKKYLALQNIETEIDHLERAIDDLKAIEGIEISLVSPEEYATRKSIPIEIVTAMSDHDRETELLNLELELRQKFVEEIETKRNELAAAEKTLDERQKRLDSIVPQIQQIRKYMTPVLQVLDLHTVTPPHLDRAARASHLSSHLSCLYINVIVYNKINEGKPLRFTCNGSIDEAVAFELDHKTKLDQKPLKGHNGDASDDEFDEIEPMEVDAPDSSRSVSAKNGELVDQFKTKQKLFVAHPISFMMELPGSYAHKTNLTFQYLPELDLVTVKPSLNIQASFEPFLNAETILDEIYAADAGYFQPKTVETMLNLVGMKFSDLQQKLGRIYKFAQQLCSSTGGDESDGTRGSHFNYFLQTILKIDARIKTREVLDQTYRNASASLLLDSLPKELRQHVPKREVYKVVDFVSIDADKLREIDGFSSQQKAIIEQLAVNQLDAGFQFSANIVDIASGNVRVSAVFHVPCGYPDVSSIVLLIPASREKLAFNNGIKSLELYLNTEAPKLVSTSPELLFALQLAILPSRIDVVSDVSERDTTDNYAPENFFFNFHIGRLNEPIFDFIPSRNAYGREGL